MKIILFGKQQLWFWIPALIVSLIVVIGMGNVWVYGNSEGIDIGIFFFSLIYFIASVIRVSEIIRRPDYTANDYYQDLRRCEKQNRNWEYKVCQKCGYLNYANSKECQHCHSTFYDL